MSINFKHIAPRLYLSFSLFLIIVLSSSGFMIYKLDSLKNSYEDMINNSFVLYKSVGKTNMGIIQVQQWLTDISATRGLDGLDDGFEQAETFALLVRNSIAEMQQLDNSKHAQYEELLSLFESYYKAGQIMAKAYIRGGPKEGNQYMGSFDKASEMLQEKLRPIKENINSRLNEKVDAESREINAIIFNTLVITVITVILFVLCWIIIRTMLKKINTIKQAMISIADHKADFSAQLDTVDNDEIGEIAMAFNRFTAKLNTMVMQIISISEQLSNASQRTQNQTMRTSEAIEKKAAEVKSLAAIIEQMSEQTQSVKKHIDSTAEQILMVSGQSETGSEVIESAVAQMQELVTEVTSVNTIVTELNEQSQSISNVVIMIANVAEQTNLLALNAAIEAARAGEHGRGFAVVADEVRNLSASTTQATQDIQKLIETVQNSSTRALSQVEKSSQVAAQTLDKSRAAGDAFQSITVSVTDIREHSADIANLVAQQNQLSEDVNQSIIKINDEVQILSRTTKESISESGDLSQYAVLLQSVISSLMNKEDNSAEQGDAELF